MNHGADKLNQETQNLLCKCTLCTSAGASQVAVGASHQCINGLMTYHTDKCVSPGAEQHGAVLGGVGVGQSKRLRTKQTKKVAVSK